MDWQLCLVELGMKPDRKSGGFIRGAMDWQLCLVDVGMKLDWKSGGLVLGKQHGNGEEKDSRKGGDFRKRREGNCNFLSLGNTCKMLWEFWGNSVKKL